jgi:hypothetical protein
MPFFMKKPIAIEARQITTENIEELIKWSNATASRRPDGTPSGMMVWTLEGSMTGKIEDYIIKGVRGEFYFCDRDIFHETYSEVIVTER